MPRALRSRVPAKITSSMRVPRSDLADCSPRTQLMASLILDFPQPFGPTIAAIPSPPNRSSVRSQNDLNPWSSTRLSLNKALTSASGEFHYTKRGRNKRQVPRPHYVGSPGFEDPDLVDPLLRKRSTDCRKSGLAKTCLRTWRAIFADSCQVFLLTSWTKARPVLIATELCAAIIRATALARARGSSVT